ncbi:unnamed protein product [Acanthoscelides obtectus]|uniref:Uncharacterized protein n=1 Tax=Acanthoscelides obtectus TaxID=200917 RepID=A0A9P0P1F3_ACAOB|nr:unnamed protein product [Acanthoscelides obtectus]CAK1669921.1 hypothetical protein AOBTE_LOCUS27306 [Acanthoscelides obtectus]
MVPSYIIICQEPNEGRCFHHHVPEKLGAMSNPFERYPAVTAPLKNRDAVKTVTDRAASLPLRACRAIKAPGTTRANAVKTFLVAVVDKRPERRSLSANQLEKIAMAYLPGKNKDCSKVVHQVLQIHLVIVLPPCGFGFQDAFLPK